MLAAVWSDELMETDDLNTRLAKIKLLASNEEPDSEAILAETQQLVSGLTQGDFFILSVDGIEDMEATVLEIQSELDSVAESEDAIEAVDQASTEVHFLLKDLGEWIAAVKTKTTPEIKASRAKVIKDAIKSVEHAVGSKGLTANNADRIRASSDRRSDSIYLPPKDIRIPASAALKVLRQEVQGCVPEEFNQSGNNRLPIPISSESYDTLLEAIDVAEAIARSQKWPASLIEYLRYFQDLLLEFAETLKAAKGAAGEMATLLLAMNGVVSIIQSLIT